MRQGLSASLLASAFALACSTDARKEQPTIAEPVSADPRITCVSEHPVEVELQPIVRALCSELHGLGGVSASVAIARGDRVVFSLAHGPRCRASSEPLETRTALRIGSITKLITATLVLATAVREGVDLDDSLAPTLPELRPPLTLRSLLGHTTGLRDHGALEMLALGEDWLAAIATRRGVPGEFHYANANYLLLGRWLERVSGRTFEELYADEPTLAALRALIDLDASTVAAPGCGHRWLLGWWPIPLTLEPPLPKWTLPAGGGLASVENLARLPAALAQTGLLDTMVRERGPVEEGDTEYGLGVRVIHRGEELILAHAGNSGAHYAELWWSPRHEVAVAVLSSTPQPFKATLLAAFDAALRG